MGKIWFVSSDRKIIILLMSCFLYLEDLILNFEGEYYVSLQLYFYQTKNLHLHIFI